MKKCPVCAVEVEDNAPFCNICGVNLSGAKDVGPSSVETPVSKEAGTPKSVSAPPIINRGKTSFYLPALQFLAAVALLGLVLYYTTADIPGPDAESKPAGMNGTSENLNAYVSADNPLRCPDWLNREAANDPDGCPLVLTSSWETDNFNIKANQYQSVLGLILFLALCIFIQARRINDSNIMAPLIFCILIMVLVYAYIGGGYSTVNADKICSDGNTDCISELYPAEALGSVYSTLGATAALVVIVVSYIVFLYAVTGKDITDAPLSTIYSFVGAGSLVFAALHHNWVRGPWFNCSKLFNGGSDLQIFDACYAAGGEPTRSLVNLQPVEMIILLAGLLALLFGIAAYILQTIRLKDMEEAKYFLMILLGLGFQFFVLVWNLVRNRANIYFEQGDIILTVLFVSIAFLGIYLFYRKRKSEQSMEGLAYFGLFAVGVGTLFATMIAPALLSQKDISAPNDTIGWVMLIIPLLVAGGAVWYGIKFGTEKFRDRMMEMQLSSPPSDPFDSSFAPEEEENSKSSDKAPALPKEITLEDAMDRLLSEFPEATIDIKPTEDANYGVDFSDIEKELKEDLAQTPVIRKAMKVDYTVDYEELSKYYSTTEETINQTVTHLKSGRNIMLYGDPGTGKTALANLLLEQICGSKEAKDGSSIPNYSIVTANAEWSNFEVIGGISPDDSGGYYFKEGYVSDSAKICEKTMQEVGKPHYLVIDEFNRANIDEAFGKLFTVFEYRDKQPLLTHKETKGAPFMMPPEFRIIGTMNTQDKNTLFNVGFALMRRFAFVEIGLPDPSDEYNRMPVFVYFKLKKLGLVPDRPDGDDLWKFGEKCKHYASRKFDFYDDDSNMYKCHEKLVKFLTPDEVPKRGDEVAVGVRTFRKIGPALLIDAMVTIFNSISRYGPDMALDKVIKAGIMPSLEGLERSEIRCLFLKAKEVLGPDSLVTETFDKMANSDSLSLF